MKIALQAYTVRDKTEKDMLGTLKKIADAGYSGIELAGLQGVSVDQLKVALDENNLTLVSAHVGADDLEKDKFWINTLPKLGCNKVTIPGYDGKMLEDEHIEETAERLNNLQKTYADAGIELSYHNHDFEFYENRMENILKHCPNLKIELDTYWVEFANVDAIDYMEKLGDRLTLIHIKDMAENKQDRDKNPVLYDGILDINSILNKAKSLGVEWAVVEKDHPIGDSLEAVTQSRKNLKSHGW